MYSNKQVPENSTVRVADLEIQFVRADAQNSTVKSRVLDGRQHPGLWVAPGWLDEAQHCLQHKLHTEVTATVVMVVVVVVTVATVTHLRKSVAGVTTLRSTIS
jgi:hypothetical protein